MPAPEPELTQDQLDVLQDMHDYDLAVAHAHWDECPNSRSFYFSDAPPSGKLHAAPTQP